MKEEIKKDNLQGIRNLFINVPKNFDLNYRDAELHDRCDTPLMQCLKYGVNLEIFKFLESKGADIGKSISAEDSSVDGQQIPFNVNEKQELVFESSNIKIYREQNLSNTNLQQKYQNAHEMLEYISNKSDVTQKNKIGLIGLSAYYLDKKLLAELVADKNIDVNTPAGRGANIAKIILFDEVRKDLFDIAFKREDLQISFDTVIQTALFENHDLFTKVINKATSHPEFDANERYQLVDNIMKVANTISSEDGMQKVGALVEKCPEEVRAYLQSDNYQIMKNNFSKINESNYGQPSLPFLDGLKVLNELEVKLASQDKEAISQKINEQVITLVDEFAKETVNSESLKTFGQKIMKIIEQSPVVETKQILAEYTKEDKNGKSKLDADLKKIEPELKTKDKLFDLASKIVKNLGFGKLSESIKQNISQEGQSSIKAIAAIKQMLKVNLTNISAKNTPKASKKSNYLPHSY
ncbi:MAG: hypothetical protein EOP33_00480 [Rickettsiaceae bacterium]|nr:MAG: hypothetical protein EOP33_00480 [Rickettsiaceae bacterium]